MKKSEEDSDSEDEKPKGGCPFMAGSEKKKNPVLHITSAGFDEPFVSKFKYYLSEHKLDLGYLKKSLLPASREIFNEYPIYLKHTLFYNGEDYKKVRNLEVCSRFMAYEELREKGNKYFNKGKYYMALDYYERAMSIYRWLEYHEPDHSVCLSKNNDSDSLSCSSQEKIRIENKQPTNAFAKQMDEMRDKYKQFFIAYNDENVRYQNGEEADEAGDIDMRKSLLVQIYLNMAAVYMRLNHFSLAENVINDGMELCQGKVSQLYLRKAQSKAYKKDSTVKELKEAKDWVLKATQIKQTEKIFSTPNQNILKMLNLHDIDQCFSQLSQRIDERIIEQQQKAEDLYQRIHQRTKEIHQIETKMIEEGKTPKQNLHEKTLFQTSQLKILNRMALKYLKVIQFYTQSKNQEQVSLAKKEFQNVLQILSKIATMVNIDLKEQNGELGGLNTFKIQQRIKHIKTRMAEDVYNSGKFNFTMLEWAIKEVVKEESEEEKKEKERQEKLRKEGKEGKEGKDESMNESEVIEQSGNQTLPTKGSFSNKLSYLLVIIPLAILIINNFVI